MILYFTGTGNSRWLAQRFAFATGDELTCINGMVGKEESRSLSVPDGRLVFVLPTYAWRIPRVVESWIRRTEFVGGKKAWFVMNCGGAIGDAAHFNRALCRDKGWESMGTAQIRMPENYVALFSVPSVEEAKETVAASEPYISRAIRKVRHGERLDEPGWSPLAWVLSHWVNPLFYRFTVKAKAFRTAEGRCVGCGRCAEVCPLDNIRLEGGRPAWGDRCTHCMACLCRCPKEAIEYGRRSVGKRRYLMEEFDGQAGTGGAVPKSPDGVSSASANPDPGEAEARGGDGDSPDAA